MFTGIIQDLGTIVDIQKVPQGKALWISTKMNPSHFTSGNSIAVNGVCLTVEDYQDECFKASVVNETLEVTTLKNLKVGDKVNLEPPLTLESPIAGHLVSGHVDAEAEVLSPTDDYWIEAPEHLMKYISKKGSITLNGVSLTVAEVSGNKVRIALIPETLERTNLAQSKRVNLEIDLLARTIERLNQFQ